MATEQQRPQATTPAEVVVGEDRLARAAEFIEEEEGATSHYGGALAVLTTTLLVGAETAAVTCDIAW